MQYEVIFAGNRIATRVEAETTIESIKTKTESGNCFCIPVVYMEYREREKEKVGDRPAKLKEEKRDREIEGEKKAKETFFFCRKNNMKIL